MAKVRYFKVNVSLNKMSEQTVEVPEWEVGVLQAQWGDDAQVIEDETSPTVKNVKLPNPRDEFERLAQRYGPKHQETPFVAGVFGNFGPGVNALADAIVRSTKDRVFIDNSDVESAEDRIAAAEAEFAAAEAAAYSGNRPVGAGVDPVVTGDINEGGDPNIDFADLAGDATENAVAVA